MLKLDTTGFGRLHRFKLLYMINIIYIYYSSVELSTLYSPIYLDPSAEVEDRVEDLLGRMTLEEKMYQLMQGDIEKMLDDDMQLNSTLLKPWGATFGK